MTPRQHQQAVIVSGLTWSIALQLTSELEELQQLLFQQKQQVASLTAQNSLLQSEVDTGKSRLQSEAEKATFAQDQLAAERQLRLQKAEQVKLSLCFQSHCMSAVSQNAVRR